MDPCEVEDKQETGDLTAGRVLRVWKIAAIHNTRASISETTPIQLDYIGGDRDVVYRPDGATAQNFSVHKVRRGLDLLGRCSWPVDSRHSVELMMRPVRVYDLYASKGINFRNGYSVG
jgi:hypothetical protein